MSNIFDYIKNHPQETQRLVGLKYEQLQKFLNEAIAFGKLFDMIVVIFCFFGGFFPPIFYHLIFSNYCQISSSTALSPVKVKVHTPLLSLSEYNE